MIQFLGISHPLIHSDALWYRRKIWGLKPKGLCSGPKSATSNLTGLRSTHVQKREKNFSPDYLTECCGDQNKVTSKSFMVLKGSHLLTLISQSAENGNWPSARDFKCLFTSLLLLFPFTMEKLRLRDWIFQSNLPPKSSMFRLVLAFPKIRYLNDFRR